MRLQSLIQGVFDEEFKKYLYDRGVNIDSSLFDLQFEPPQNFATYRQAELDNQRAPIFQQMLSVPIMSKRFALKRFLGLSDEEIAENERMWAEENGESNPVITDSAGEMRGAGISQAGIESDLSAAADTTAPEDMTTPGAEAASDVAPEPTSTQASPTA